MRIIYGTSNKEKLAEVKEYLEYKKVDIELISSLDIGFTDDIEETGTTFEENSMIKAKAIKKYCNEKNIHDAIMTDDAGLCIDALNGEPGVYSARYFGNRLPQKIVIDKMLEKLKDVQDKNRKAEYVCVLTLILEDGTVKVARGETLGKIATKPGPLGKLTYCPIFIPNGFNKTMNELTEDELGTTHREKALNQLLEEILL